MFSPGIVAASHVVPAAGAFSPASISGLNLWLEADAITGLVDNDPVSAWADRSPVGASYAQGTAGSRPTFKTGILNGLPVVRFDGGDALFAAVTSSGDHTVFVVASANAGSNGFIVAEGSESSATPFTRAVGREGSFNQRRYAIRNNAGSQGQATVTQGWTAGFKLLAARRSGTAMSLYDRGGAAIATATAPGGALTTTGTIIGGRFNGTGAGVTAAGWTGDIAAVVAYDTALSLSDLDAVGEYLADKYALTWSAAS